MKNSIIYLAVCLLIIGCGKDTKTTNAEEASKTQEPTSVEASKFGRSNYAVVWKWSTSDTQLISDNMIEISGELNELWKEDIIENVYYNSDAAIEKLGNFPNISFFIKAQSDDDAKSILDGLIIVKKGIATYTLYPVGNLWLERKADEINTKSYVAVWSTTGKPSDELAKSQNDAVIALWNEGKLENAYFDIQGTQKANNVTDFVFFVNADSEEEAKAVCNSLPFSKENMATYKLHEVGVFWMGKYENK